MSAMRVPRPILAVAGAGPGIGEAIARCFAAKGFVVALLARTEDKLSSMVQSINDSFGEKVSYYFVTDLANEGSVIESFRRIRTQLGSVEVLVYNAGARRVNGRTILDTSTEEFENFTKINMFGAFWATKCVLSDMLAAGHGTILYTGATGSLRGASGLSSFSPGKFGLRSLSQIVAREYQEFGIHSAHVIVDGPVDGKLIGEFLRRRWKESGDTGKSKDVEAHLVQPSDLAEIYWSLYSQPKSTWTQEMDVRAQKESIYSRL